LSQLIAIEGLDGAGTTTQARRLVEHLRSAGRDAHLTREPSDGPIGRLIREMLIGRHAIEGRRIDQSTFSLLFTADRMDHCQREVEPMLAAGAVVVSDRWYHSSLAYQGTGADRDWIALLNARARVPDLTLLLRVDAEVAARRRIAAGRAQELFEDLEMQRLVQLGYTDAIRRVTARGERVEVIDGHASPDEVHQAIVELVRSIVIGS
jgi:dTMP kinase